MRMFSSALRLSIGLLLMIFHVYAHASVHTHEVPQLDLPHTKSLAEKCRRLALQFDWLSVHQDYPTCKKTLSGESLYLAAYYLEHTRKEDAKKLIEKTLVNVNYSRDINCYGQEDMEHVALDLNVVMEGFCST